MNKLLQMKIILKNILITEKPSVAMEFSKVLKENGIRKNGYIESTNWDNNLVQWVFVTCPIQKNMMKN